MTTEVTPTPEPQVQSERTTSLARRLRRQFKDFQVRRRRARSAKRKKVGSRKLAYFLAALLLAEFALFAYTFRYVAPDSPGRELALDQVGELARQQRINQATFREQDDTLVLDIAAQSAEEKAEKAEAEAQDTEGANEKDGDASVDGGAGDASGAQGGNDDAEGRDGNGGEGETVERPQVPAGRYTAWSYYPSSDAAFSPLFDVLQSAGARVEVDPQTEKGVVRTVQTYLLPLLILATAFGLLFTSGRGGGSGIGDVLTFGQIGKKKQKKGFAAPVTFNDVGGAHEAVMELREVVDYLKDPDRYEEIGAVPPKGVLLFGPPGCGKTLLAKAVAGEAGVPFFSVAGAEFVESLVGVGAARVRDLFARVRAVAPAIIFIDELDAAGRKRGGGEGGGGDGEREQTLNQLLVEMDGFEVSAGIVVMGATNRPDILDPALLRPGRFDRHITVDQPDAEGRETILRLHARGKPMSQNLDYEYVAKRTPGFSGADLANVINEAALLSIREKKPVIELPELEEAIQRVLHGPKRRGRLLSEEERTRAAYHESGHAIIAAAVGRAEKVHRVSILQRGRGIGLIGINNESDAFLQTRADLFGRLVTAMGGLAAEELILGEPSTGAEEDLEQATGLARDIVGRYGMTDALGRARLIGADANVYLGGDGGFDHLSEQTHIEFDLEVRRLLGEAEKEALRLLHLNRNHLDDMAADLSKLETLEGRPLDEILRRVPTGEARLTDAFNVTGSNGHSKGNGSSRTGAAKTRSSGSTARGRAKKESD
jgi:cell division protease FtsH